MTKQSASPRSNDCGPKVSVVTAFLNEAKFLEDAIESVIAQTFPSWELILIDDGSTDGSTEIARRYADQLPDRVRYLDHQNHANLGAGPSRNAGVRATRGEHVAFLDGDDIWMKTKLQDQVGILDDAPRCGLLYGRTLFWHFDNGQPAGTTPDFVQDVGVSYTTVVEPPRLLQRLLRNEDLHPAICSWLVRRDVFVRLGGFDSSFAGLYEDSVFLAKALLSVPTIIANECSAVYRLHSGSRCHAAIASGEYHETEPNVSREEFLRWLQAHFLNQAIDDALLRDALRRELWPYEHPVPYRLVRAGRTMRRALGRTRLLGRNSQATA